VITKNSSFWRVFDRVLDLMAALSCGILVFMTAAVCYTIFMRFLFTRTTIWVMQATEYGLLWVVFLSTAWLLREQGHVVTEILHSAFSSRIRRYVDTIMFVLGGLACAICAYYAIGYTYDCATKGITDVRGVTVPKAVVFSIVPLGFSLLTVQFFRMVWDRFSRKNGS
jgi:C4-dicarboxylate transporter, DctQ subunit